MAVEIVTWMLIFGFAQAYAVSCLLLEQKESHEGPFKLSGRYIKFPDNHTQRATLFDLIRWVFRAYTGSWSDMIWRVHPERSERWTCPFCLSFWVGIPFTALFIMSIDPPIFSWIIVHFGIAFLSSFFIGVQDV